MKKCSKCGDWKDESAFYKDKQRKDGLNFHCKLCIKKYHGEWRRSKGCTPQKMYYKKILLTGSKICSRCLIDKDGSEFNPKDGRLSAECKSCSSARSKAYQKANQTAIKAQRKAHYEANKDRLRASTLVWRKANRDKLRSGGLEYRHGITEQQRAEMIAKQDNKCFICGVVFNSGGPRTTPCVDHDHFMEGKGLHMIRKVLCGHCNKGLGLFKDDPALLRAAAAYLDPHHARNSLI